MARALPLSAAVVLDQLRRSAFASPAKAREALAALLPRLDEVSWRRRVTSMALAGVLPFVLGLAGWLAGIAMQRIAATAPDTDALVLALSKLQVLEADPAQQATARALSIYIAGTYPKTLTDPAVWSNPLLAQRTAAYNALAKRVAADHRTVTTEELAAARVTLGQPFLDRQARELTDQQRRAQVAPRVAAVALFVIGLFLASGLGVAWAIVLGNGLFLRACGLALVTTRGAPVSRLRAAGRAIVVWLPACLTSGFTFRVLDDASGDGGVSFVTVATAALAMAAIAFVAGAIVAAIRPTRGCQDVIAGTFVVPR